MVYNFKSIATITLLVISFFPLYAQLSDNRFDDNDGENWTGGGALAAQSSVSDIYSMLVDESIFMPTYNEERIINTIGGTIWTRFGAPFSDFFIEGQFSYLRTLNPQNQFEQLEGGHFYLRNDMDLEYSILFAYQQVGFGVFPGWFLPLPGRSESAFGVYLTAGLNWYILTGTSIDYISNEPQFDLAIEENLEQGFKYRNDLVFLPGVGVQGKLNDDFALELRYSQGWGLLDIMETQNNPYFWRERINKTRVLHQIALTALIRFHD